MTILEELLVVYLVQSLQQTNLVLDLILLLTSLSFQIILIIIDMLLLERVDSMTCITLGEDSQMLLKEVPPHVRTLDTDVQFSTEIGEYILFYTTEEGQTFSAERAVYGMPYPGGWHFELPRGHIEQIRLDTGVVPAVTCNFSRIEWNALSSIWELWQMDTSTLFWCAVLPGFAVSAILIFRKSKKQK